MNQNLQNIRENLRYLRVLSHQYPTIEAASTQIIYLQAVLNLPKGTEHFMSDLHGEYEAFVHILNNASGAIKEKVDILYANTLSTKERAVLATLIYYTEAKLKEIKEDMPEDELPEWYKITLNRLMEICRLVASKYTRSKVREALPKGYEYIIDELLHTNYDALNKEQYYENIIATIIDIGRADAFINAVCLTIKRLIVDRLHIVGDIFDRGPRADIILDLLERHHRVDIQWGNHDILWMGAAAGSRTCIANVLNNSITYNNLEVIETGYGISLRPLATFANEVYRNTDISCFKPRVSDEGHYNPKDLEQVARMHKAIAVILFKLEGQIILRNPGFRMENRLLLDKIDYDHCSITIDGKEYPLKDCTFPTVNHADPYRLSPEEAAVMSQLRFSFQQSEKLQRHVKFLYSKGGMYLCCNQNLLFHGCIPMDADGNFSSFETADGQSLSGKAFLDYTEAMARQGYYAATGSPERQLGKDFLWFLWCGSNSPLFGRDRMTTFERLLVGGSEICKEQKNPYYLYSSKKEVCLKILQEFGLNSEFSHIINGHVPVRSKDGEKPVKAGGKLIVIDGGFCKVYQSQTGIAGYTLIYNSHGIRITSHEPFAGVQNAIRDNKDILSTSVIFETRESRIKIGDTDDGRAIREEIEDLKQLLEAYQVGLIKEGHRQDSFTE